MHIIIAARGWSIPQSRGCLPDRFEYSALCLGLTCKQIHFSQSQRRLDRASLGPEVFGGEVVAGYFTEVAVDVR